MHVFRKLIRDRIPEIMQAKGQKAITRVLSDDEYIKALENKLLEEVQEMRIGQEEAKTEIADIYEVLDALIKARGFAKEEILDIQAKKREERGGFEKKIFLEGVEE